MVARRVELEGAFNLRDLGGYRTASGSRVRWRWLFRSDSLHRLTETDVAALAELGVHTVIDLRTGDEVRERGSFDGATRYHHLPLIDQLRSRDDVETTYSDPARVTARYLEILDEGRAQMTKVLELLSDESTYPAVFHCAAGRDRTGVVAATVLGLLGVSDEDIVADYVLSQEAMERLLQHLKAERPDAGEELDRVGPGLVSLFAEAMSGLLNAIRERFGSFEGYADAVGVPDAAAALKTALLE
jgi:protein tyrosine/serine phosphatase